MDGRGAAGARQQRRVNVDESETRDREHRVGEDPAVGDDDREVGVQRRERLGESGILEPFRLQQRTSRGGGAQFHRRVGDLVSAATRTIGLGDDAHDVVLRVQERIERGHGELGRAEEDNAERVWRSYHLPARVSFLIFRTIRSRLMPRSLSTKRVPSR